MDREIRLTGDGSHTLYVRDLDEPYHSVHGAIQESRHVFIDHGLRTTTASPVRILEMGMGTGLNLLLTLQDALKTGRIVFYHGVEKYPLNSSEYKSLNYTGLIDEIPQTTFNEIHEGPWGSAFSLGSKFTLLKEKSDFREFIPTGTYDLVYFDAFDPAKQPELWSAELFRNIWDNMAAGGVLVTYSSKGDVRRSLISCGFRVEKVPGPPGKREMVRATAG